MKFETQGLEYSDFLLEKISYKLSKAAWIEPMSNTEKIRIYNDLKTNLCIGIVGSFCSEQKPEPNRQIQ